MHMRSKKTSCRSFQKKNVAMATRKPITRLHVEKSHCDPGIRTNPGNKPRENKDITMKAAHVPKSIEGKPLYSTIRVSTFCH